MNKYYTFLSVFLFCLLSFKVSAKADSYFCEQSFQFQAKGINCCLSSISESQCLAKVNDISPRIIAAVSQVKKMIQNKKFTPEAYPNCHWTSLYAQGINEATRKVDYIFTEFPSLLERDFFEIQKSELKYGDMVVVWFQLELREKNDDGSITWTDVGLDAAHSSLYIGDDLVFQKENSNNAEFSIQNLNEMLTVYQESYNSQPKLRRGVGHLKFYRKK
jgi:predicted nucleic-acid-binding Zn-ribbon protein